MNVSGKGTFAFCVVALSLASPVFAVDPVFSDSFFVPQGQAEREGPGFDVQYTAMLNAAIGHVSRYHQVWSLPNETTMATLGTLFAPNVDFYGGNASRAAVMAEKQKFVLRWPVRDYRFRADGSASHCDANRKVCVVMGEIDWDARDPAHGRRSVGVASVLMTIDLNGPQPLIIGESGRVLTRQIFEDETRP